jgi:hypothetical protein
MEGTDVPEDSDYPVDASYGGSSSDDDDAPSLYKDLGITLLTEAPDAMPFRGVEPETPWPRTAREASSLPQTAPRIPRIRHVPPAAGRHGRRQRIAGACVIAGVVMLLAGCLAWALGGVPVL